ncbi:RidA family protein [Kiloniella antarctica]|uniref:RidA family protein n=1 Tax=Kiloniella antarctica TaxID=1550907 RepID=A0ABW5BJ54_9PROT
MTVERVNYLQLGLPVGPYTHAVIHGNTLYTSGFTAFGTEAQESSISQQAKAIFEQLEIIARAQKTNLENLIKVTIFVTDLMDMAALRNTLSDLYGTQTPASSLIKIQGLFAPELKIEIEAIFAL